jgi:hypothetical protein
MGGGIWKLRHLLMLAAALVGAGLGAFSLQLSIARNIVPENRPESGLIFDGLSRPLLSRCADAFELPDGSCTRGPDPAPPGVDISVSVAPLKTQTGLRPQTAVICDGDGQSGRRIQTLYVRGEGKANRFAEYRTSFKAWMAGVDAAVYTSAQALGSDIRVRFVTDDNCEVDVQEVPIPDAALASLGATIEALRARAFNRPDRKYLLFVDANVYCGLAQFISDDSYGPENRNNEGALFGRVDAGCWGASIATHELMHVLGAVQDSAPNTTFGKDGSVGGHCIDEYDVMCYSDAAGGKPEMRYVCAPSNAMLLDCNYDDYFHPDPPPGSYLATHWNTANSLYLIRNAGAPGVPIVTPAPTGTPPAVPQPPPGARSTLIVFLPWLGR